jgi:hypothetical protein
MQLKHIRTPRSSPRANKKEKNSMTCYVHPLRRGARGDPHLSQRRLPPIQLDSAATASFRIATLNQSGLTEPLRVRRSATSDPPAKKTKCIGTTRARGETGPRISPDMTPSAALDEPRVGAAAPAAAVAFRRPIAPAASRKP